MANHPRWKSTSPRFAFFRMDTAEPAPFADREFGLASELSKLLRRVPFARGLALNERDEHFFDFIKPFIDGHKAPKKVLMACGADPSTRSYA